MNKRQSNNREGSSQGNKQQSKSIKGDRQNSLKLKQRVNSFQSTLDKKLNYNFTVAVRVKPKLPKYDNNEYNQKDAMCLNYESNDQQTLILQYPQGYTPPYSVTRNKKFNFDSILIDRSNKEVYHKIIKPKISILRENINLTLLTYGITGSGKTHTIFGSKDLGEEGIALMCFDDVLKQQIVNEQTVFAFSFMQIYNQQVHDLLQDQIIQNMQETGQSGSLLKLKSLNVLEDSRGKVNIPQLTKIQVRSINDLKYLIQKGNNIRACSSNLINKLSSRSHALLQLYCYNKKTKIQNVLTIIDLAGSERNNTASSNYATRDRSKDKENFNLQKEGSNINRSLLALGSCIKGLESGESHIPYRDSKLTRILKDDLSGKAHNIMIACVGRNFSQAEETVNTLQYASKAAKIKVQKMKNMPKNEAFQCCYCFKLTSWKDILDQIPQNLCFAHPKFNRSNSNNSQQNQFLQKLFQSQKNKKQLKNSSINSQIQQSLSEIMGKLKNQIVELFNLNQQVQEICSGSNCLFGEKGNIKAQKNTARQIMSSGVDDIFNFYQEKLAELVCSKNDDKKINIDSTILNQNSLNNSLKLNLKPIKYGTTLVQKKQKPQLCDTVISEFSKTLGCLNVNNNCSLQSYREQVISQQNMIGSNLRKKFSLKSKNYLNSVNSTNSTLNDLSKYDSNKQKDSRIRSKTQRMNPDIQIDQQEVQKVTQKSAIMKKIEEAKKKYTTDLQYTHQNCSRFQYQDSEYQQNEKITKVKLKNERPNTFINIKQQENKNQIYVSSFMEDSNQFQNCC